MKTNKNLAISINKRLSNLSKQLDVPHKNILTEFLIERLLARIISDKELHDKIVFKGGYVCLRVYASERYTMDLDAVLQKGNLQKTIERVKNISAKDFNDGSWFIFEKQIDLETQGEYGGIRLIFRAGVGGVLKNINRAQIIQFDLGLGDPITPSPFKSSIKELLGNNELSCLVYPVETTVAEKLHALVIRGSLNSRSKDIFDLWYLLPKCDSKILKKSLINTFKYRGDKLPGSISSSLKAIDTTTLSRGWHSATATIKTSKTFYAIYKELIEYCEKIIDA
jgi:predicted nucleotidyltransferase component of viral defense system